MKDFIEAFRDAKKFGKKLFWNKAGFFVALWDVSNHYKQMDSYLELIIDFEN